MWNRLFSAVAKFKSDDLARHGALMVLFGLLAGLLNYVYQVAMGIMLTPSEYGTLFSLVSLSMILAMLTQTFQTSSSRFTSTLKLQGSIGRVKCLWRFFLVRALLCGGGLFLIVLLLTPVLMSFLGIDDSRVIFVLSASLILSFALPVNQGLLQGLQRFLPLGFCQMLLALLKLGLGAILVYLGLGVSGALLPLFIGSVVVFMVSLYWLRDVARAKNEKCQPVGIFSYTGLTFVAIVSFGVLANVDVILAKHYLSADVAGDYSALSVLGRMALYVPMGIGIAMFPKTSELFDAGGDYRGAMRRAVLYTVILGGIVIGAYCLFFGFVVDSVFGGKYHIMLADTVKYALAMLLLSLSFLLTYYFLSVNRMRVAFAVLLAACVQVALIANLHSSVSQITNMVLISGVVSMLGIAILYVGDRKRYR